MADLLPPPFPESPEDRRAWLIDRCTEIKRHHMEAAEAEMKPYLRMLEALPTPRIVVSPGLNIHCVSLPEKKA